MDLVAAGIAAGVLVRAATLGVFQGGLRVKRLWLSYVGITRDSRGPTRTLNEHDHELAAVFELAICAAHRDVEGAVRRADH